MFSQLLVNNKNIFIYTEKELIKIEKIYNKIIISNNSNLKSKIDNLKLKINELKNYTSIIDEEFETLLNIL
jgi:hypothetical protein